MSTPAPRPLRVPVLVDRQEYDAFKAYSEVTGIPMSHLIREAMREYADVTLTVRLEAFMKTKYPALCTLPDERDTEAFAAAAK